MKKILLLEDNPLDADLVYRGIKTKWPAVEMIVVNRLAEARQILTKDSSIELAIFDLGLPDGNGLDLLSELRASDNQIPIIILTGSGSEEIAIAALKAGASNYISKKPGFHEIIPEQIKFAINHNLKNKKHLSVLYLEHQKSDFDLTNLYFKKHAPFINLKQVSTGEEGLKLLPKNINLPCKYDVLLLDYRLPGLNALEITKTIRLERKLNIPIIVVTGQGDEYTAVEALKVGVDDYIVKRENYLIRLPFVLLNAYRNRELEQQQQALKLSETKFRLLADFAADWEFWVNPMGEYIYISPSCEKICGYPPEAFVKNKNLLTEITHPDYRAELAKHFTQEEKELHKPIEFIIHTAGGEEKWISHYCRPVYDDNNNY
jgi:PAS domain S-box-containing protein